METVPSAMSFGSAQGYAARGGERPWHRGGSGGGYRRKRKSRPHTSTRTRTSRSPNGLKVGLRVRHPTFGVGTVTALEPLDDDVKLVVRFLSVGPKTLRAKFAKLEPA